MAKAFAADFRQSDFDAALIANDAAMLHALVLAAQALPIGDGAKNLGAEKTVTFGLEGAVVDGLGLGDFTVRPGANFFRTRQRDADGIEICDQAGAIIRAAAIQGCFLPPWLSPGLRTFLSGPAENQKETSCLLPAKALPGLKPLSYKTLGTPASESGRYNGRQETSRRLFRPAFGVS